jgi:hypothetical protein
MDTNENTEDRRHPPVTALGAADSMRAPEPGDFPEPDESRAASDEATEASERDALEALREALAEAGAVIEPVSVEDQEAFLDQAIEAAEQAARDRLAEVGPAGPEVRSANHLVITLRVPFVEYDEVVELQGALQRVLDAELAGYTEGDEKVVPVAALSAIGDFFGTIDLHPHRGGE